MSSPVRRHRTVACSVDAHSSAAGIANPRKAKAVGTVAYARWPEAACGKRVTSTWNRGFPSSAALSDGQKKATGRFISGAASAKTHARRSRRFAAPARRSGVRRVSAWRSPEIAAATRDAGDSFIPAALESLEHDTDLDWRTRAQRRRAIGDPVATAIQAAFVGQKQPKRSIKRSRGSRQILKG